MTLTEARNRIGWTQTQLARAVGAGVSTVNELEKSAAAGTTNSGYSLVMRIVKVLQQEGLVVTAEDIFPVDPEEIERRLGERRGDDRREGVA